MSHDRKSIKPATRKTSPPRWQTLFDTFGDSIETSPLARQISGESEIDTYQDENQVSLYFPRITEINALSLFEKFAAVASSAVQHIRGCEAQITMNASEYYAKFTT